MALFRVDYSGRGELSERQQKVRPITMSNVFILSEPSMQLAQVFTSVLLIVQ
jgi:hypothetical protein